MTEQVTTNENAVLHLRKDGETKYVELSQLDVTTASSDEEIKREIERHFDLRQNDLESYVVERLGNDISVRPPATYG